MRLGLESWASWSRVNVLETFPVNTGDIVNSARHPLPVAGPPIRAA